jgi:hypothetical protein
MTQLFTYTIPYDDGAAPNPFHGICTLAICKPSIRRVAVGQGRSLIRRRVDITSSAIDPKPSVVSTGFAASDPQFAQSDWHRRIPPK